MRVGCTRTHTDPASLLKICRSRCLSSTVRIWHSTHAQQRLTEHSICQRGHSTDAAPRVREREDEPPRRHSCGVQRQSHSAADRTTHRTTEKAQHGSTTLGGHWAQGAAPARAPGCRRPTATATLASPPRQIQAPLSPQPRSRAPVRPRVRVPVRVPARVRVRLRTSRPRRPRRQAPASASAASRAMRGGYRRRSACFGRSPPPQGCRQPARERGHKTGCGRG